MLSLNRGSDVRERSSLLNVRLTLLVKPLVGLSNVAFRDPGRMKRKVVKLSGLRLSPNEEAFLIKEEHERRRRLRIKQVREQERSIAVQIREEIKHRRNQQLEQLANELRAEWQMAQMEKAQSLEKLYLSGLKAVGEGHRQAKENEPDLKAHSKQAAVNTEKAEKRHREALRELKQQKDKEHEVQNRYIKTRKRALLIEKKRALKIAQLPPPPPNPLADLEVQKYPAVKMYDIDSFSETRYHLPEPFVDRESDTPQISAQQTAQEEAKHLEDLQQEAEMERLEQLEKARLRGSYALQLVHLIQDKKKLVKELEEMQQADLARRRQTVPRMPPQLFEPPYRLVQAKEDQQREMEFAFEDMYAGDQKVRGDLILRLEHEPLPAPTIGVQDEDLDLSVEPDGFQKEEQDGSTTQNDLPTLHSGKIQDQGLVASSQPFTCQSNAALRKLFTKIKTQRDHCSKPEPKCMSKDMTIESGSITSGKNAQRTLMKSTANNLSEEHLEIPSVLIQANKQQNEVFEDATKARSATLCHPKEQATSSGSEIDRRKQLHELEHKKQQQLHLIWQSGQQKLNLEPQVQGIQLQQQQSEEIQMQERVNSDLEKRSQQQDMQTKEWLRCQELRKENTLSKQSTWRSKAAQMVKGNPHVNTELEHHEPSPDEPSPDDEHMCTIHQYQQHLIEQNSQTSQSSVISKLSSMLQYPRLHKTSLEGIRKQLDEYRLKKGWSFVSTTARHLSEQQLPSCINHYDKSIGSELKVDVTRNKPEVTCVLSAQYPNFENRSRTLYQRQPITVPFVHLQQTKLPYKFTCQSLPVNQRLQVRVGTVCLPESSENASGFSSKHQLLKNSTLFDSALFKTAQQNTATTESTIIQQQRDRVLNAGSNSSGGLDHVNQNQSVVYNVSNSESDLSKSKIFIMPHGVHEVNGVEVSEPCATASGTVEPQQELTKVGLMQMLQNPLKPLEGQQGTPERSVKTLIHSIPSSTLTNSVKNLRDQERSSAASTGIQVQKEHLKDLHQRLCRQRENLVATQMLQEQFMHRQQLLKKSMQDQHNTSEINFVENQDLNTETTKENFQSKNEDQLEDLQLTTPLNVPTCKGNYFSASQNVEALSREDQYRRPSKPPVTKIRLGPFGLFDQHELSAIQEGESPKSDRLSLFVNRNTPSDNCCCSEAEESRPKLIDSSCSSEIDLSNVSTSSSHQMSNISNCTIDSHRMSRMTWRDKLKLEISSLTGQGSSHVESSMLAFAGPTHHTASKVLFPYSWSGNIQKAPEEGQLFSTTLSTGSFPSNEPTDIGPVSPGDHSSTAHDIVAGQSTAPSTSTSHSVNKDTVENQDIDHCCPSLEECIPTGRKIQQVVEKYTRNLNQWLSSTGKNQDPPTGHNTSTQGVPNFHLELQSSQPDSDLEFQPLETIPDFGFSSTSLSSTSSKNKNVLDTDRNTQNQHSNSTTNSEIKSFTDSIEFTPDHGCAVCNASQGSNCIQQNYDVENGRLNTFQPLQLEISSSKYSLDTDGSSGNVMCNRYSEQGFNNCASSINSLCFPPLDLIRRETVAAASQTLESIDQSTCSENIQEHFGSFSQLNVTWSSENDHNCDIPNQNGKHLENCESVTSHAITFTENIKSKKVNEVSTLNGQTTELSKLISVRKRNCTGSEVLCVSEQNHMAQSGLLPCGRTETAAKPESKTEQDQHPSSNLASKVCTLHSIIPAREIESNIGIMEEPELPQLSLNDSTLVDEELGQTSPIKSNTSQNEFQTFTQVNELQPSKLKTTDHAITSLHNLEVADCKINHMASSQNSPKAMIFQFDSPTKILNEVVLKRKHKFLANSKKRVEDMKRKGRSGEVNSELLNRKIPLKQEQPSVFASTSVAAYLKMVGEVKVSTPEDRKAAELEMRERTFRLYSQLDEVKTRKKEVTRQLECTRNREKAKEFQKKTLEKLRAMKTRR
ncbi:centrosomal protein of 295 kDa [Hemiscyllium ocellatum]|uniref:centrosomal protein of 295 kDa n=1 Tax=Hemiscyllium ocellatum TaxID=170820 RepID=UPI0029661E80|nr:centrosomal protein of 295 kDa [Hemiscyllium ocellatum]